jgi:hypothetical protein
VTRALAACLVAAWSSKQEHLQTGALQQEHLQQEHLQDLSPQEQDKILPDARISGDVMRVLVGGAGFIGSRVCGAFAAKGDEVHVVDDLSVVEL